MLFLSASRTAVARSATLSTVPAPLSILCCSCSSRPTLPSIRLLTSAARSFSSRARSIRALASAIPPPSMSPEPLSPKSHQTKKPPIIAATSIKAIFALAIVLTPLWYVQFLHILHMDKSKKETPRCVSLSNKKDTHLSAFSGYNR